MTEKNKPGSYDNIKFKKIVLLKLIHNIADRNEIRVHDLINRLSNLHPDTKMMYGLNYKGNSMYRSLDRMAEQNLIEKYKKDKLKGHSCVKISEFGLKFLRNIEKFFGTSTGNDK